MYYKEQTEAMADKGKFREDISKREPYSTSKIFKIGFIDDSEEIRTLCPDCKFSESSFKIGALYEGDRGRDFGRWTSAEPSKIQNLSIAIYLEKVLHVCGNQSLMDTHNDLSPYLLSWVCLCIVAFLIGAFDRSIPRAYLALSILS